MKIILLLKLAFILLASLFLWSCTESPIGGGDITRDFRQIQGSVILSDSLSPDGVFVWLDGFDMSLVTKSDGRFEFQLPSPSSQGTPNGYSGVMHLYYYLANYYLEKTTVFVQNGQFVYSQGEIGADGNLLAPKEITKFLEINTTVSPSSVPANFQGTIELQVTLGALINTQDARLDTVSVTLINFEDDITGRVFIKNIDTGEIKEMSTRVTGADKLIRNQPEPRRMNFFLRKGVLKRGRYEIIPHLLIKHQAIPEKLLNLLGLRSNDMVSNYLQLPIKREGGFFEITN
ncbi:MAG: hypothetical protein ACE5HS_00525 [bacterium]